MGTVELSKTLQEIRSYQHLQEEITAELDALKDAVKAELTARNTDELTAGDFKVAWKAIVTSRLDGSALKAAAPNSSPGSAKPPKPADSLFPNTKYGGGVIRSVPTIKEIAPNDYIENTHQWQALSGNAPNFSRARPPENF